MRLRLVLVSFVLVHGWLIAGAISPEPAAKPASILIAGGTVVDGTGASGRRADVRISGDRIVEVGALTPRPDERLIDARRRVVAPGFIDTHSHADRGLLEMPEAESQIRQGITTAVVGQDGGSNTPLAAFFESLQAKRVALNVASFVGHGTLRRRAMGTEYKRAVTPAELAAMEELLDQEMKAGGLGLSTGLEYDPGFYSTTEELIACAKVAARHGGLYISHVRDEANEVFPSFRELIRIAEEAHLPGQISHIKLGSNRVWGRAGEAVRLIDDANRRGVDVTADVYPYLYWQSTITALIPTRDWENRGAWEKGLAEVGGARHVMLTDYTPDPAWAGKTIAEIADRTKKDPVTVIQEIVRRTHGEVDGRPPGTTGREGVVVTAMAEEDLRRFVAAPRVMFCTDGGLRSKHPRGAGTYPRILGRYVREQHLLSLEEAIRKMTSFPARRMGFRDRGVVQPGMKADLVLFDPRKVLDTATPADPGARPIGISHVLVNGVLVLEDGKMTGERPGRPLRHESLRAALGSGEQLLTAMPVDSR
jgi:N-acyl-D-amino-acid deacylase